jgi:hypothetical protein
MSVPEKIKDLLNQIEEKIMKDKNDFLIGCIDADEDAYSILIDYAKALISKRIIILKEERYAIVSVALVLFAVNEYQNGQFWSEFSSRVNLDESNVKKYCKESFESYCDMKGLYFHVGKVNKGYVTSILTHAIIPKSNTHKFIEFLHDLYFKDLEEDYIDQEVEELIQYMHRLFTKYLEEDDISFVVQGSKMTIARQQLPKAFRIAFVKAANVVAPLIERLLLYIHQVHYGERVEFLEKDRFDQYFASYDMVTQQSTSRKYKQRQKFDRVVKFHKAQYHYEDRKILLQIPKQIIDSDYIESQIVLEIYSRDKTIHTEELLLTKSRLFFRTEQTIVQILQYDSQLAYRIKSDDIIIYDSGDLISREFIIFDLDGNEVNPKDLTDETVRVVTLNITEVLSDDAQIDIDYESNYRISTVFMNKETILLIDDKVLSTNVAAIRNEVDSSYKYQSVSIKDVTMGSYDVYSKIPVIRIRMPYLKSVEDYIVTINGSYFHLHEVADFELKLISDGSGDELAVIRLKESVFNEVNTVSILIREKGSNRIYLEKNIFILGSLHYEFDKDYYYKEKEATLISLYSDVIDISDEAQMPATIKLSKQSVYQSVFHLKDKKYVIELEIPVLTWRMGSINSSLKHSDHIWWKDLNEYILYISFPNFPSKLHIVSDLGYEKFEGKKIGSEVRFTLNHLFQVTNQNPITLGIRLNGDELHITDIHFKPVILDFSVAYYDNRYLIQALYGSWRFLGQGDLEVDLIYSPTRRVIKHYILNDDENLLDKEISLYYSEHEIEIYQIEEDFFGEGSSKNILLHENFIVGDEVLVMCKDKTLKGVTCESESEKFELSNFYLKDVKFAKKRGFYEATGLYHIRDRFTGDIREWYFTNHNPFILKPIGKKNGKFTFEIVDRDEDGLIYDIKTKYVNPREDGNESRYRLIDTITLEIHE